MVFGLFSKDRALQRTIDKAINKLAQQPDRWGALEKLREDGSDEALYGLCKRFGITSMKGVEDEQEKNWVVDVLIEKGPLALPNTSALTTCLIERAPPPAAVIPRYTRDQIRYGTNTRGRRLLRYKK